MLASRMTTCVGFAVDKSEIITNVVVLIVAVLAGVGGYLRKRPPQVEHEFERDFDKLLRLLEDLSKAQIRMAVALEVLADRKQSERDATIHALTQSINSLVKKS